MVVQSTTESSSQTTGCVKTAGGFGVAGDPYTSDFGEVMRAASVEALRACEAELSKG